MYGRLQGADFVPNVMPAGGGRLAMSVSKAMLGAAALGIGELGEVQIPSVGRGD